MRSQDVKASAHSSRDIDSAIESASRDVEGFLNRRFFPWTGTRYFDFPSWPQSARAGRIWLEQYELADTPTAITTENGAVSIPVANVILDPQDGPPYTRMDINRGTDSFWSAGTTYQRAVAVTGTFGYSNDLVVDAALAEALDASETGVDIAASSQIGVGSILVVDSERMVVTGRQWLSTGQTASLTAANSAQAITVSDGTQWLAGETLLIDSERLLVVDVSGNVLTVTRAVDGSALAAHTTTTLCAPRTLVVQRGALGTTAATHSQGTATYLFQVPGGVAELTLAWAINHLLQRQSGWSRTVGGGDNSQPAPGDGLTLLERRVKSAYGRGIRKAVI